MNSEKENILEQIKYLIIEKKLNNFSINDVENETDLKKGQIYSIFSSKEKIITSLLNIEAKEMFLAFDEEVSKEDDLTDKLKKFISLQFEFLEPLFPIIKYNLGKSLIPFTEQNKFQNEIRKKYLNFLKEIFLEDSKNNSFWYKNIFIPNIANSFLLLNLSIITFWDNDKNQDKKETLHFIDKSIKYFMSVYYIV